MGSRYGALLATLLLGVTACGSSATVDGSLDVALVVANAQLNFSIEMADGFRAGVAHVGGVNAEVTGPDIVDGPRELEMFEELAKTADDGVSVFTLSPEIFAQPLADAVDRGLPIIAVDNPPLDEADVGLYVGNDNHELGRLLAAEVVAALPSGATGTVILGTSSPGVGVLDRRAAGIRDGIRAELPGVTVLGPFDSKQDTDANKAAWKTLIRANPDALAFLGTGDADGWNLAALRAETGGTWLAGAFDLDDRSLAAVKAGELLLVSPEHFVKGEVAGRLQAGHAKSGKALPKGWYYIPGLAVNSTNIDAVLARQKSPEATEAAVATRVDTILTDRSYLRPMSAVG
ncbi:sugar ABC transporter substrate-binding protein [Actinoplanes sp. NPDC051851]|uniref:sugar ABC transporter substrate-binding protein n=1 Tax=Actinoplanes sp. NPDC051851 TaxID=3154753 RepID=UPI00344362D4